jgi:hypothetical protein
MSVFRNFINGFGYMAEGLVAVVTLGLKSPNLHYTTDNFACKIEFGIKRYLARREWNRSTFRIAPEGGTYRTRENRCVQVRPNTDGWYDGLAFKVYTKRGIHFSDVPAWTVDERGWAYPGDRITKTHMDVVEKY